MSKANTEVGCPYSRFNWKTMFENCTLTGRVTEGEVECDYSYEQCPEYQKAVAACVPVPPQGKIPSTKELERMLLK